MTTGENPEDRETVGGPPRRGRPPKQEQHDCVLCDMRGLSTTAMQAHLAVHGIRQRGNDPESLEVVNPDRLAQTKVKPGTTVTLPGGIRIKVPYTPEWWIEESRRLGHMVKLDETNMPLINDSVILNGVRIQFFRNKPIAQWWKWREHGPQCPDCLGKGFVSEVPAVFLNEIKKYERSLTEDAAVPKQASDYERGIGFGLGSLAENRPHRIGSGGLGPDMAEQESIA